ncbi:MAG: PIG-L family deacetylase [Vicinamibacterales bacterium]
MRVHRFLLAAVVAAGVGYLPLGAQQRSAQYRVEPLSDLAGAPALTLALRKLNSVGTLMQTTAHPDDENNAFLAVNARRFGHRVALVTATRGDGGQNEIGPELFDALGILRSEELLTAHRWDGAEQYFTRAVDFGYSFSPEETMDKWGKEEIIGDFVRHIRTLRPDVITTLGVGGQGGGQHHQTSAMLTLEAYKRAADPAQFPEQIRDGLKPWQPRKLYQPAGGPGGRGGPGGPGGRGGRGGGRGAAGRGSAAPDAPGAGAPVAEGKFATVDANLYEPQLGCTIAEVGSIASGMHMCQGRAPIVGGAGAAASRWRMIETTVASQKDKDEASVFDGIDTSLASLATFAGDHPPAVVTTGLAAIASRVTAASKAFEAGGQAAALPDLLAGLVAVRTLRSGLAASGASDIAQYEIDFRLKRKQDQFQDAIAIAHALRIDALSDDGLVVAGQPVNVSLMVANRGASDVTVKAVTLAGLEGSTACAPGPAVPATPFACDAEVKVPAGAKMTGPYWVRGESATRATFEPNSPFGYPFVPTPFVATVELDVAGTPVTRQLPVQFRYEGASLVGEKRMELKVVPAFNVRVAPINVIVPTRAPAGVDRRRDIRVTVQNQTKGPASGTAALTLPPGWRATPATIPVAFTREDESVTVRFRITPPVQISPATFVVKANVTDVKGQLLAGNETFDQGYQIIEYPHTQRRHKTLAAQTNLKVIDVAVAPNLSLGYVMGVGDQVPAAIEQLGVKVHMIDEDELAYGNLSIYDTIMLGVRAYERREDLKANNARLLKYVENGGTLIVQYNKMEFNQAQYAPYPAQVSSNRVTDEGAPVEILQKEHHAFTYPNRVRTDVWDGWVQERGLYFLGERDAKFTDLVKMQDPFAFNPGDKTGALVEARFGKGRWVYVGLGLWRQLPAGTVGAYQLMANLISLGKAPAAAPATR